MGNFNLDTTKVRTNVQPYLQKTNEVMEEGFSNASMLKKTLPSSFKELNEVSDIVNRIYTLESDIKKVDNNLTKNVEEADNIERKQKLKLEILMSNMLKQTINILEEKSPFFIFDKPNTNISYANKKINFFPMPHVFYSLPNLKEYNNECYQVYFNSDKFKNYSNFKFCLVNKYTNKLHRDSSYATQGCCDVNGTVLVTSYDTGFQVISNKKGKKHCVERTEKYNSVLDIVDSFGRFKILTFDNTAHVGGIAYDNKSGKLYVSNEDAINCYDIDYVSTLTSGECLTEYKKTNLTKNKDGIKSASYLTAYNGNLYAGEFDDQSYKNVTKYNIDSKGNLEVDKIYEVPYKKVQGMCIYEYKGEEYYFFSSSYGRGNDSNLYVAKLENDKLEKIGSITMPCMSEGISIDNEGNLMVTFESDCMKYGDGADGNGTTKGGMQVGNVCYLDPEKIIFLVNQ